MIRRAEPEAVRRPSHRAAGELRTAAGRCLLPILLALLLPAVPACDRPAELELVEGAHRPGELGAGEVHVYRLRSPVERAVEAAVVQRGADVALSVLDAAGSPRAAVDRAHGPDGEERLFLLAEAGVSYRLEVRAADRSGGRYEVRVERVRAPSAEDRRRAAGELALARAQALLAESGRESWLAAADRYRAALAAFRELDDAPRRAEIEQGLGRLHRRFLEDPRAALGHYEAALALYRALGEEPAESVVLNNLGRLHFELGESERAVDYWRRALPIKRRLGDRLGEAATLANLAQEARYQGEVQEALTAYDRSIELLASEAAPAEPGGHGPLYLGRALNNRGKLYLALGDLDQALADLERAVAAGERIGDLELQAIALSGVGAVRHRRGELDAAVADLERALELRERSGAVRGRAVTLLALGRTHAGLGRHQEALDGYERALALFRELESPRDVAHALVAIADPAERGGEPARALGLAAEALELFRRLGDRAGEIEALLAMARAERGLGRHDVALARAEEALATAEALRLEAATPDLRASYFAALRDHFDLFVELLMDRHLRDPGAGFDRRALEASERFRARSLLDLLRASRDAARDRADPELFARRRELEARIRVLASDRSETGGARLAEVESRLGELVRAHRALGGRIRGPASATAEASPALDAAAIQALLDPGTALLEYHLGARRSRLWVITAQSLTVFELPPRDRIERAARRAHQALQVSHRREYEVAAESALAALGALVLDPAVEALGAERLLVAADGALHYVPFAALPLPHRGDVPAATGGLRERLLDRYEVAMVPSASAVAALRGELSGRPRPRGLVAVIGDPVFEAGDPRLHGTLPSRAGAPGTEPASEPRPPAGAAGPRPRRLAFAGEEARAVLALAPADRRLGALGLDATRERATAPELGGYRIVHFATHAYVDPERPELSRLAFSLLDPEGRPLDGWLYAFELRRLDLAADLVVLSGCETALGREIRGEGLVGLTQGLFDAGAAQVLVSLWPVDDRATAELMSRFYRGVLADGLTPEAALRAAQRSLARVEGRRAPYYWAGWVLQGEGRPGERRTGLEPALNPAPGESIPGSMSSAIESFERRSQP